MFFFSVANVSLMAALTKVLRFLKISRIEPVPSTIKIVRRPLKNALDFSTCDRSVEVKSSRFWRSEFTICRLRSEISPRLSACLLSAFNWFRCTWKYLSRAAHKAVYDSLHSSTLLNDAVAVAVAVATDSEDDSCACDASINGSSLEARFFSSKMRAYDPLRFCLHHTNDNITCPSE